MTTFRLIARCAYCGTTFKCTEGQDTYCSDRCSRKGHAVRREVEQRQPQRLCCMCQAPIPSDRKATTKTCSEKCAKAYRKAGHARQPGRCINCEGHIPPGVDYKYCSECWRREHPVASKVPGSADDVQLRWLLAKYELSLAAFHQILGAQRNRCGVCGTSTPGRFGWQVEEDRRTGRVQRIVCDCCKVGLNCFAGDPMTAATARTPRSR